MNFVRYFKTRKKCLFIFSLLFILPNCGQHTEKSVSNQSLNTQNLPVGSFQYVRENVLIPHCVGCHSNQRPSKQVNLITYGTVMKTGSVIAGRPEGSHLLEQIEKGLMPPPPKTGGTNKLSPSLIDAVREWIEKGAQPN